MYKILHAWAEDNWKSSLDAPMGVIDSVGVLMLDIDLIRWEGSDLFGMADGVMVLDNVTAVGVIVR